MTKQDTWTLTLLDFGSGDIEVRSPDGTTKLVGGDDSAVAALAGAPDDATVRLVRGYRPYGSDVISASELRRMVPFGIWGFPGGRRRRP